MRKAISKEVFDEIVGRAACTRPVVAYRAGGKPSVRVFGSAREAFEFVYNTLGIMGHATFSCAWRYLDGSGKECTKEAEIRFDSVEGICAYSVDGKAPSSCEFKGRDEFADEFVYRLSMAIAAEIHSGEAGR